MHNVFAIGLTFLLLEQVPFEPFLATGTEVSGPLLTFGVRFPLPLILTKYTIPREQIINESEVLVSPTIPTSS